MTARIAYLTGIFALTLYGLVLVAFQLRGMVALFEGLSLALPLPTRVLIMLSLNPFVFLPLAAFAVVVPTLLAWLQPGARWLGVVQLLVSVVVSAAVVCSLLPFISLLAALR